MDTSIRITIHNKKEKKIDPLLVVIQRSGLDQVRISMLEDAQ